LECVVRMNCFPIPVRGILRPSRRALQRTLSWLRGGFVWALLIAAAFAGLELTAVTGRASPDSKNYISYALTLSGESRERATARAIQYTCASDQEWTGGAGPTETWDQCVRRLTGAADYWAKHSNAAGMTGPFASSRFMAIFEARPGYPSALALFLSAFGLVWGIWLLGLTVAVAGSLGVLATLRALNLSWPAALSGQVLYLALPTGTIAMLPLSDGLTMACGTLVVLGCVLASKGRRRLGALLIAGGLTVAFLVRYSQAVLLAAVLATFFLALTVVRLRQDRPWRAHAALVALCGGLAAVFAVVVRLLGWPTWQEGAQYLLTDHYRLPDVHDLLPEFFALEQTFLAAWVQRQLTYPVLPAMLALSVWVLLRRPSIFGLIAAATSVSGFLHQASHPNLEQIQGYRLIVFIWFLPVLALPLLVEGMHTRHRMGWAMRPTGARAQSKASRVRAGGTGRMADGSWRIGGRVLVPAVVAPRRCVLAVALILVARLSAHRRPDAAGSR
jgi:hypothetical protein